MNSNELTQSSRDMCILLSPYLSDRHDWLPKDHRSSLPKRNTNMNCKPHGLQEKSSSHL